MGTCYANRPYAAAEALPHRMTLTGIVQLQQEGKAPAVFWRRQTRTSGVFVRPSWAFALDKWRRAAREFTSTTLSNYSAMP